MLKTRAWKWKLNQSRFIQMQFLNCGKCNVGLQGNMNLCMLSVQNSTLLQRLGEVCSMCEMVHRGGQFWHVLPCVGLPPCVKWDLSSMFNFSNSSLKLFLIKCVIQPTSIMRKKPSMCTQEYREYFWSSSAVLQKCQTPLKLAARCQLNGKSCWEVEQDFWVSAMLFRSTVNGVGFLPCERNFYRWVGKLLWLAWAHLGAVRICHSGIDSVVGALVSCLLQIVHIVLFFGLKWLIWLKIRVIE